MPRLGVAVVSVGMQEHLLFFRIRAEPLFLLEDTTIAVERTPRMMTFLRERGRSSKRGRSSIGWHADCVRS